MACARMAKFGGQSHIAITAQGNSICYYDIRKPVLLIKHTG